MLAGWSRDRIGYWVACVVEVEQKGLGWLSGVGMGLWRREIREWMLLIFPLYLLACKFFDKVGYCFPRSKSSLDEAL